MVEFYHHLQRFLMAKVLYICKRNGALDQAERTRLAHVARVLVPDSISDSEHLECTFHDGGEICHAVSNDKGTFLRNKDSLLCGYLQDPTEKWHEIGNAAAVGDYAIFRADSDAVEVLTNRVGSRTVWYFMDEEYFLASTSQRALIVFLGRFEFDERVIPWVISTGTLGPALSWDRRVKRLPVASVLKLARREWALSLQTRAAVFDAGVDRDHKAELGAQLDKSINSIVGNLSSGWKLPLSGGYDSRAILCFMSRGSGLPEGLGTLTWTLKQKRDVRGGDARVAARVAAAMNVHHEYLDADVSDESVETILDRFLFSGEGRVDHASGYMDGMTMWKHLHDAGVKGLIRGDEGFGWVPVNSETSVRTSVGCGLCSDFGNLERLQDDFGIPRQEMPADLERRAGETLETWRDRLYHEYRIPTMLAGLSDLKLSYVELVNPLLSDDVIACVRRMPDRLRTGKSLFMTIVDEIGPRVEYASSSAVERLASIVSDQNVARVIREKIGSGVTDMFGADFLAHVLRGMEVRDSRRGGVARKLREIARKWVPAGMKLRVRKVAARNIDPFVVAFRVFIIIRMHEILSGDARVFSGDGQLCRREHRQAADGSTSLRPGHMHC